MLVMSVMATPLYWTTTLVTLAVDRRPTIRKRSVPEQVCDQSRVVTPAAVVAAAASKVMAIMLYQCSPRHYWHCCAGKVRGAWLR